MFESRQIIMRSREIITRYRDYYIFEWVYAAFIRNGDYRISQFTTREERSFEAEVWVIMGNIP